MKTIFASLALALLPAFAHAECAYEKRASLSCPEGTQWDTKSHSCVTPSS